MTWPLGRRDVKQLRGHGDTAAAYIAVGVEIMTLHSLRLKIIVCRNDMTRSGSAEDFSTQPKEYMLFVLATRSR